MTATGRPWVVAIVTIGVVLLGGCASTGSGGPAAPIGDAPPVIGIPWTGSDVEFLHRAMTVLEGDEAPESRRGNSDQDRAQTAGEPPPTAEIALGSSATLTELVLAASFVDWDAGRTMLVDAEVLEERAVPRLDRVVLRRRGESVAGYLDVDGRRLSASLGLHWSGWTRLRLGTWRDPRSQVEVHIPRNGGWIVSRGPEISVPLEESITGGAVGRLAAAGSSEPQSIPLIVWVRGLAVAGIPPRILPSRLALLMVPADSGEDLSVRVVLPFSSERDARVALVASRLVVPHVLHGMGLGRGPDFGIIREGQEIYIVDVVLSQGQLTGLLAESVGFMTNGEDQ